MPSNLWDERWKVELVTHPGCELLSSRKELEEWSLTFTVVFPKGG